jgi:hypothetical protein
MTLYQIVVIVGKRKCAESAAWDKNYAARTGHGITAWMELTIEYSNLRFMLILTQPI